MNRNLIIIMLVIAIISFLLGFFISYGFFNLEKSDVDNDMYILEGTQDNLVGDWIHLYDNGIMTFYSNGSMNLPSDVGTYEVVGNRLIMSYGERTDIVDFYFIGTYDKLALESDEGFGVILTKQ